MWQGDKHEYSKRASNPDAVRHSEKCKRILLFAANVFDARLSYPTERPNDLDGHCELQIGPSTVMFAKSGGQWKPRTADMFVYVENADETYDRSLEHGATTIMEPADQNYGRSCGVTDPFGNIWWITSVKA